ncbi:MAG: hypothetical protein ACRD0C_15030 [Acidimicrobiia bacterium]
MALVGAVYGRSVGDLLLELPLTVITATVVGAAANKRLRPGLAGLTAEQVRRVVRWVRRGEVVDDRAVAEAVIVHVRDQERSVALWGRLGLAGMTYFALAAVVAGDGGLDAVVLGVGFIAAVVLSVIGQRIARRRWRAAVAAARSVLGEP